MFFFFEVNVGSYAPTIRTRVSHAIDAVVVLLVVWADDAVVDDQRAVELRRQVAPYDEDALWNDKMEG